MEKFGYEHNNENESLPKMEMIDKKNEIIVPENEITFGFSRSSGKGGQNVNKRSTRVQAQWNIDDSPSFSEEEKQKIRESKGLKNKISEEGVITISRQRQRTQKQNREEAIRGLNNLVALALEPEEERIPTKPTKSSKQRREEEKKHQKQKKELRSKKFIEYE